MKLSYFGSGCLGDPVTLVVEDCADPDNVTFSYDRVPDGANNPVITPLQGGQYEIVSNSAGAFVIGVECCG